MRKELVELFNKQINREFYTGYLYYAMSTHFDEIMMKGFSMYMKHLSSSELKLAQKMYDYLILRDEKLYFLKIDEPLSDWDDVSDIFTHGLAHEQMLISEIENLYLIAKNYDDIGAIEFIKEILNQKMKSLSSWRKIVFRIKNSNTIPINIDFMDNLVTI